MRGKVHERERHQNQSNWWGRDYWSRRRSGFGRYPGYRRSTMPDRLSVKRMTHRLERRDAAIETAIAKVEHENPLALDVWTGINADADIDLPDVL